MQTNRFKAKSLESVLQVNTQPLSLPAKWRQFLGEIPRNAQWTMLITGPSFGGKSTFALKFANILTANGDVLYVNAEEFSQGGTLQEKLRRLKVSTRRIKMQDSCRMDDLHTELKAGNYKFCVFDSVSKFAKFNKITVLDVFMLHEQYPDVSFIYVLFTTKDGKTYKGESDLIFLSEVCVEVADLIADCSLKNRYKRNRNHFQFDILKN